MPHSRKILIITAALIAWGAFLFVGGPVAEAQARLTYPEINTALQAKLPSQFKNRSDLIKWLALQIQRRKMDKPLTKDREDDLRQAGATDELIAVIRANSPALAVQTPTPVPRPTIVDLGNLAEKAINLVKPEYTPEARKAGTSGEVKLSLELDEEGRVTSIARLVVLPDGLTERAIEAARQSRFTPAQIDGKPAKGKGILTYNFKINLVNAAAALAAANDFRAKGNCDAAIAEYSRLISVEPNNAAGLMGRGTCYVMAASYDRAAADLEAAAKAAPGDAEVFFYLGIAHDFRGDAVRAGANYGKAVTLNPQLARRPLMECLFIEKPQMTEAQVRSAANSLINACNQALRNASEHLASLIYVKRGIAYRLKADYDKAIEDFEAARKANPQFTAVQSQLHSAYNSRGLLRFEKKDYRPAFNDITTAISINPQSPTPYVNRCVIYLYAWKQFDEAITDCTSAIRLGSKSPMVYIHRGQAYEMKNSTDAAIADYSKALEIDPRNETARANLNRVQRPSIKK